LKKQFLIEKDRLQKLWEDYSKKSQTEGEGQKTQPEQPKTNSGKE
jgi:hypothetical protein